MPIVSEFITSGIQKFVSKFTLAVLSITLGPFILTFISVVKSPLWKSRSVFNIVDFVIAATDLKALNVFIIVAVLRTCEQPQLRYLRTAGRHFVTKVGTGFTQI
jgi:hypothetical protein